MMRLILLLTLIFPLQTFALEIDEKLTLRIVKTSSTKKTLLINRGIEDGLVKGDHAKFFLSAGVVARGVVIKLSPTRSVWSIYRIVNKSFLKDEQVMKLKITPPVKITKDESRTLVGDDSSISTKDPRDLGIPLADGAEDLTSDELAKEAVGFDSREVISLLMKNKEVFGSFTYSSMSAETVNSDKTSFNSTLTNMSLTIGMELYFKKEREWFTRLGFLGAFKMNKNSLMAYQGATVEETTSEFGAGVRLYPTKRASETEKFIPYLGFMLFLGTTNSSYNQGEESTNYGSVAVDASLISYDFSFGYKYFTRYGMGFGAQFSYYLRGNEFGKDQSSRTWVYTSSGPKLGMNLSYRF